MSLTAGSRIGAFEILSPLGAGGMGEVSLARDTRLGREVAIKALPDAFAHDPERLARFEREARLLASLKHPNIAAIHGLEEANGQRYLILEYVPGPTLADRLASGPLPIDEAIEVCTQIAAGVEAAHESGVVHRDLKPANVKLTPAGEVKVLDFGLAKGASGPSSSSSLDLSNSPTLAHQQATTIGVILGTAAYMSPEQARGRPVDRRTDIWSFGCVLYECLTGRQLYEGETVSDLIARILEREPDWSVLPAATPSSVRELLRRCLMKDPRERLRDIGEARITLAHAIGARDAAPAPARAAARRGPAPWMWIALAAALVGIGWIGTAFERRAGAGSAPLRVSVLAPEQVEVSTEVPDLVISPDGTSIVFMGTDTTGTSHLWLRLLASETARMLPGTDDAKLPFWSPDSREIGFFAEGQLKRIGVSGDDAVRICAAPNPRGGAWGRGGLIVFAPDPAGPLMQVNASGGEVRVATMLDTTTHETTHRFPTFFPDGRHFLYVALPGRNGDNVLDARVGTPGGKPGPVVCRSVASPTYAAGWIVYLQQGTIVAQRFDPRSFKASGAPRVLRGFFDASGQYSGSPVVTASQGGILLQRELDRPQTHLEFRDRNGRSIAPDMDLPAGSWSDPHLSPDGTHLVLDRFTPGDPVAPLWMVDLVRRTTTRFTFEGPFQTAAVWTPDGRRVIYGSDEAGRNIYWRRSDGSGNQEILARVPNLFNDPMQITPDGKTLIFRTLAGETGEDIWRVPVEGGKPEPVLVTKFTEVDPAVSPDGRWMAYRSDESGRMEIYVQSYPAFDRKIRVTRSGASPSLNTPLSLTRWRSDGRELFYLGGDGQTLMAVDVTPGEDLKLGDPHPLYKLPYGTLDIDLAPDGQRIILCVRTRKSERTVFNLAMNWQKDLERQR